MIGVLENCEGKVSTSVADLVNRELRASSPLYLRASCKDLEVGGVNSGNQRNYRRSITKHASLALLCAVQLVIAMISEITEVLEFGISDSHSIETPKFPVIQLRDCK